MPQRKINLPAKVSAPFVDRYVPRKEVFVLLAEAHKRRAITWISAPGGAGKTMLTKSYLDSAGIMPLWYQVDRRDEDPATIFHYLSMSVAASTGSHYQALPALTPEYLRGLPVFAANFFESLFAQLAKPTVLVFDNCQDIPADSPFFTILRGAVEELWEGCHIICISREKPPAEFAAFRAKQLMSVIDENMLRFTADEISELAELNGKPIVDKNTAEKLASKTLGWAAGLVLLIDDPELFDLDDSHYLTSGSNLLFDYFANEFFNQWDDATRDFLIKTALLPRISSASAEAISKNNNAADILERLLKKNFFTILYSNRPRIYQYHPLFREFLLAQVKDYLPEEEFISVHADAAKLLLEDKYLEDAVALYIVVEDWSSLGKVIIQNAKLLISKGRFKTLSAWIDAIPESVREAEPWLVYWAGVGLQPFNPKAAYEYYERAFDLFMGQNNQLGMVLSWVALPDAVTFSLGNYQIFDDWLEKFERNIGADYQIANDDIDARLTKSMLNIFSFRSVERKVLDYWIDRGAALLNRSLDVNLRVLLGCRLFHTYFNLGLLAEEKQVYESVDALMDSPEVLPVNKILWSVYRGLYGWTSNQSPITDEAVREGIRIAEASSIHALDGVIYCIGALHCTANADIEKAKAYLDNVSPSIPLSNPLQLTLYYLAIGSRAILEGDHAEAVLATQKSVDTMRENGGLFPQIHCQLVLAHALLEQGNKAAARENIQEIERLNEKHQSEVTRFQVLILHAYMALLDADTDLVLEYLRQAMDLASQREITLFHCGFRRDVIGRLCALALQHKICEDYLCQQIRKYDIAAPANAGERWPWMCQVNTLGRFEIILNGKSLDLNKGKGKPQALIKALLAFGGRNVPEDKITEAIWPDAEGDAAHSAFSTTMHRLRKALGRDDLITIRNRQVSFNPELVWIDYQALACAADSLGRKELTQQQYAQLTDEFFKLYRGDFLLNENESWMFSQREKIANCFLRHVAVIAEYYEGQQNWERVVELYQHGLEVYPLSESFYQGLLEAYCAMGHRTQAIDTYQRCVKLLQSELSQPPSAKLVKLYESLLKGDGSSLMH